MINCNASKIYQQDIYQVDKPLSNNGMDQKEIWRENLRALAARCKTKFIPKIKKVYQLILHLSLSIDIVHSIAAKHPLPRSLTSNQYQKHQQIICCALAKTYGRHS